MMRIVLMFLFCSGAIPVFAQADTASPILDRKLNWDDFTGEVDKSSQYSAMTYWNMDFKYGVKWNSQSDTAYITFTVVPLFNSRSWVKQNLESGELLKHEQGHYDMAIICAGMLKEKFVNQTFFKNDYAQKIGSIYQSTLQLVKQMELQYDAETNHMLNKDEQAKWNQTITGLLSKVPFVKAGK